MYTYKHWGLHGSNGDDMNTYVPVINKSSGENGKEYLDCALKEKKMLL